MSAAKTVDQGKETVQAISDVVDLGIPGLGLVGKIINGTYQRHLKKRFESFIEKAELDAELLEKIESNEDYSSFLYSTLETVRSTHSKIGLIVLALIYRDHWDDSDYLISALQAFNQIHDKTIRAFITLYDGLDAKSTHLELAVGNGENREFHPLYNEAVELIRRNIFVMSEGGARIFSANGPIQGMKWDHTDSYYEYCFKAEKLHK